jgi:hypothetical protein
MAQIMDATGKLYCYQLLLLAFAFVIKAPIAAHGNKPAVHNLLDFYFSAGRTRVFLDAALMIYRPPLLDILPIYVVLMAGRGFESRRSRHSRIATTGLPTNRAECEG